MTNEPTPTERILATQAAQLQTQMATQTRGSFWDVIGQIIPARLLIVVVLVFGGFEAFKYWQGIQQSEAQVRVKEADAALAAIESETLNLKDDSGDTLALAKAKADLDKAQADAARTKVEADALNAKVGDTSMRLEQLKAELAAKSAKAAQTRLEAKAALDRTGLLTLEQRAARAKLEITELKAAKSRWDAAVMNGGSISVFDNEKYNAQKMKEIKAYCVDNPFARDAGCPREFITREPPKIQTAVEAALARARGDARLSAPPRPTKRPSQRRGTMSRRSAPQRLPPQQHRSPATLRQNQPPAWGSSLRPP